ncbi:DUF418 domain-containing protein [Mucilaginibacter ginkgonis]|uniref:DUF418 domain-containing protein n=1 Tax=Mucilaginibacter ginkgonis TaxID=2682091 RepID=A0A6I4I2V9_9SPHI|nr:DUF418 domain-containing protein [Mucilaginibacter ginkgonis]QQL49236.1 DUF418 domain-containing protein [Mucilaginibacter ginkgonis]
MKEQAAAPIRSSNRVAIIDILRGWAILGVVLGNYTDYSFMGKEVKIKPDVASTILEGIDQYVFAAKSWTLLSVLFGYGFAVVIANVTAKGKSPVAFFIKRMFWLLVIAFVNSAFWFGDILKDYAVLGLLLLLFYKASAKTAFYSGLVLLISIPLVGVFVANQFPSDYYGAGLKHVLPLYYSHNWADMFKMNLLGTWYLEVLLPGYAITVHVMMFACMLFGFSAQRINLFSRLPEFKKPIKQTFWISLAAATLINLIILVVINNNRPVFKYFKPRYWAVFATMIVILSGICWLYINNRLRGFFAGMQAVGKMTLTNYMTQNIIAVFIFLNVGFGLFNTQPYWIYIAIAISVFAIQIPLSILWLKHFNYGPVEWIWRQLTYGKRLPLKREKTEEL